MRASEILRSENSKVQNEEQVFFSPGVLEDAGLHLAEEVERPRHDKRALLTLAELADRVVGHVEVVASDPNLNDTKPLLYIKYLISPYLDALRVDLACGSFFKHTLSYSAEIFRRAKIKIPGPSPRSRPPAGQRP